MLIKKLPNVLDQAAMIAAQGRSVESRHPRRVNYMGTIANAAIAKAAARKAAAKSNSKSTSKPTKTAAKSKKESTRGASDTEKSQVVKMFNAGKPVSEISEAMGWVKKGNWPHYYTLGVIRQLRKAGKLGYAADRKESK